MKAIIIGIGISIAAIALPAAAAGKVGHYVTQSSRSTEFKIMASNGYSVSVSGSIGAPKPIRGVTLTARNSSGASVSYLAQGVATEKRIEASFGALGRISVRFHPSQPARLVRRAQNCRGPGELVHEGHFVGTIQFEGEQGYTALHASRARGQVTRSFKEVCSEGGAGQSGPIRWTMLDATSTAPVQTSFEANGLSYQPRPHGPSRFCVFLASIYERQPPLKPGGPGLSVIRSILATARLSAISTTTSGRVITSALVTPPAPFTGTAYYTKGQGSQGSWSGSLAANFPGRGELRLAGPGFSAQAQILGRLGKGKSNGSGVIQLVR
jgi:hypothetical protein